jgi:hypothetical protein
MPYVSKAERQRADWRTLVEAVDHVRSRDKCDEVTARQQLAAALADGALEPLRWEDGEATLYVGGATMPTDTPPESIPNNAQVDWDAATVLDEWSEQLPRRRRLLIHRLALEYIWPDPRTLVSKAPPPINPLRGGRNPALPIEEPAPKPRRGPKKGAINRYAVADRALYPELEALMKQGGPDGTKLSATAASSKLAEAGKLAGGGTNESKARRLRGIYTDDHPDKS